MDFLKHLLGDSTIGFYGAALIFIFLGFITNKVIVFKNRTDKEKQFSWKFWVKDNIVDVIIAFLLSFTTVRFTDELIGIVDKYLSFDLSSIKDAMFYYYIIGLSHQSLLHIAKKKFKSFTRKLSKDDEDIQ